MRVLFRTDGVSVFQSAIFLTTSTVLHSAASVVVIDPTWLPDEVMAIRRYVEGIGQGKEWYVLLTHSDYDHILGWQAFPEARVIASASLAHSPHKKRILKQVKQWDADNYVQRPWPVEWPRVDVMVEFDAQHMVLDEEMSLRFWLTPGHNPDGIMVFAERQQTLIVGDYLSDVEFPFIDYSYLLYEDALKKMELAIDTFGVNVLVPGHGHVAFWPQDMCNRLRESWEYLDALWAHVAGRKSFDEAWLWSRYPFAANQVAQHLANIRRAEAEIDWQGRWLAISE